MKTASPAEAVAAELLKLSQTQPGYRAQQLGSSAHVILAFVQDGTIAKQDAYSDLHAAALATGLDSDEVRRTISWAWGGDHMLPAPRVKDLYPAACPDAALAKVAHDFRLPDDFTSDEVASRREAGDETIEFPTFGVAAVAEAARGLDMLAVHLRSLDGRSTADVYLGATRNEHLADQLASVIVGAVKTSAALGLDLGEALARVVPDQASS